MHEIKSINVFLFFFLLEEFIFSQLNENGPRILTCSRLKVQASLYVHNTNGMLRFAKLDNLTSSSCLCYQAHETLNGFRRFKDRPKAVSFFSGASYRKSTGIPLTVTLEGTFETPRNLIWSALIPEFGT